jgi:hypothetical protein
LVQEGARCVRRGWSEWDVACEVFRSCAVARLGATFEQRGRPEDAPRAALRVGVKRDPLQDKGRRSSALSPYTNGIQRPTRTPNPSPRP